MKTKIIKTKKDFRLAIIEMEYPTMEGNDYGSPSDWVSLTIMVEDAKDYRKRFFLPTIKCKGGDDFYNYEIRENKLIQKYERWMYEYCGNYCLSKLKIKNKDAQNTSYNKQRAKLKIRPFVKRYRSLKNMNIKRLLKMDFSEKDMVLAILSNCADMCSRDGCLISVNAFPKVAEQLLIWKKNALQELRNANTSTNKQSTPCEHVSSGNLNYMQTHVTCNVCGADMDVDV